MAHSSPEPSKPAGPKSKTIGLLAQFDDPDSLVAACERARDSGYQKFDAYSPFPVHGIDPAIGIRRTWLPFFVLFIGLSGCLVALAMQYYMNAVDWTTIFPGYAFYISGKPLELSPANIPVTFEVIILSSAFAAFFGMWLFNRLPQFANPLHRIDRFRRATNDRFFLMVDAADAKYDANRTRQQFEEWGATAIETVNLDLTDQEIPKFLRMAGIVGMFLLLVPPVMIFRAYGSTNRAPRLHVVPDMDWQDKYKAQQVSPNIGTEKEPVYLYADDRAMRAPVAGTIARGDLEDDDRYYRGYEPGTLPPPAPPVANGSLPASFVSTSAPSAAQPGLSGPSVAAQEGGAQDPATTGLYPGEPDWVDAIPEQFAVTPQAIERGKQRFEIYCAVCHGYDGNGNGLVNKRALALAATGQAQWTTAKSLHDPAVKVQPVGRIFDTISHGRNSMGPYRAQIPVADRWAIVLYVKALQETGILPPAGSATPAATNVPLP